LHDVRVESGLGKLVDAKRAGKKSPLIAPSLGFDEDGPWQL
jgi:hypothetical protein